MSSDASTSFPLSSAPPPPLSSSSYGSLPLHLQPSLPTFGPSDPGYYASTASAPYSPPHVHSQQPLHNFFAPHPPSAAFPGYQPPPSFSSHSTSYPSHPSTDAFSTHPSTPSVDAPPSDRSASTKPPVGSIRCYWVILSARLDFVFLDPILEHHMGDYAIKLVGTNLLDWVHPDEKDSLRDDLMPKEDEVAGIEGVGVFGSMTRCRYSRVVRIMRDLGCERPPQPEDAKIYAIDDEYLNLDVTTSWIAGDRKGKGKLNGAVLAFFHATTDKDAQHDNDLRNRSDWTNWCGPNDPDYFTPTNCAELLSALSRCATVPSPSSSTFLDDEDAGPPAHVFQILDRAGRAIATFPKSADHSRGEKGKSYDVEEFAALAREVLQRPREAVASKTSCTRRYRSKHPVMKDGTLTTVESVVIMYGAITFACFQTGGVYLSSARKAGLSLSTDFSGPAGGDFNLEDVPPTTPTVSMGQNGHSNGIKRSPGDEDGRETSMSPPNKRFKTSTASEVPSIQATAPPNDSMDPPQPINGLSILTGGRMFRNTLDVESITAGGISPTVATASAILGSFSLHNQPPQFQQYPHYTPPLAAHSPSQPPPTSYNAFFASHGPPLGHTFAPFPAPSPQMSYPPPSSSSYSYATQPHPLSQSHSAYFPPAQQEPHEPASGGGAFPGPTSRPFQGFGNGGEEYGQQQQQQQQQQQHEQDQEHLQQQQQQQQEEQQETFQEPAPPPPPPQPTTTRTAVIMPDPALIPVPPPPPPGSQAGKKPPKQRPEGPVFKPNVKACESCGTVNSPEWRKGPTGAKSLCNACGLRYARSVSRAKKLAEAAANGTAPKKGGKKKAAAAAAAAAAAVAAAASANDSPKDSPGSSSQTSPLPPQHPPTIITNLPPGGAYDLSGYARASPKPYSPYFATAPPPAPGAYVPSPTGSQGPSFQHSPLSATSAPGGGGGGASQYFPSLGYSAAPPYSAPTMHSPLPPVPNPSPYSDYPRPSFSHSHSHSNSLSHSHSHSHPHSLSQSLPYSHSYSHASSPHLQQQQQQQQQQPQQQPQSLAMYPSHSDGSQSQHSSQQQQSPQVPQQGGAGSYAQQRFNGNGGWGGGQDEGGGTNGNRNGGGGGGAEGEEGG